VFSGEYFTSEREAGGQDEGRRKEVGTEEGVARRRERGSGWRTGGYGKGGTRPRDAAVPSLGRHFSARPTAQRIVAPVAA
jgi:hypothetical protein